MGEGGGGEEEGSSLPFSLPSFPFSPETPHTQANSQFPRVENERSIKSVKKAPTPLEKSKQTIL